MAAIYANLILRGRKTLEDVPAPLRAQVGTLLEAGSE